MFDAYNGPDRPLRILHVLRAPIGGLFRHVLDLTREQIARGHAVGLITDATTGGAQAASVLRALEPRLGLGLSRIAIPRNPHWSDLRALAHVLGRLGETKPDVVHGHGSKGAALARASRLVPAFGSALRVYTPHGGSLNHRPGTLIHRLYMGIERALQRQTDLLLFESSFIAARYNAYVGRPGCLTRVVHNGIGDAEFLPVIPDGEAADFLYVGELRSAKGIDVLLEALARAGRQLDARPSLCLVGSGPDRIALEAQAARLGLTDQIAFHNPLPARQAFTMGRTLVVPSRAESLPYVVLEAAGACVPMIATNVGGIPEIFGPYQRRLISADSVPDLSDCLIETMTADPADAARQAAALATFVHEGFSTARMVESVLAAYRDGLQVKRARAVSPIRAFFAPSS